MWPQVSNGWVFALGLLLPIYTITGYDASAHTSEETKQAALSAPRGIVSSILWSGVFGYLFLAAFVLMIPNMDEAANQGWNVFFWAMDAQVPGTMKEILYVLIFVAQILCGLATVTSASRMIYAFSRDGGLPFSKGLARVSPTHRTPNAAIWTGAALAWLFVWGAKWLEAGGTPVYTVVVSCTVIFLFFSFAMPITLGLFTYGGPKWQKMGPWNIGRAGYSLFAVLSIIAMVLIFVIGVQPPNALALNVTIGFLILTAIVWFALENRRFKGPPIGDMIAKRQAEIAAAEAALERSNEALSRPPAPGVGRRRSACALRRFFFRDRASGPDARARKHRDARHRLLVEVGLGARCVAAGPADLRAPAVACTAGGSCTSPAA